MLNRKPRLIATAPLFLMLAACGAGGGAQIASTPPPPASPPPPPAAAAITIFAHPNPETYAVVGASISGPGGNLDTYESADSRFGTVSSAASGLPQIRYTSAGNYEIKMPGSDWDRLVPYAGLVDPGADNNYFQPASIAQNYGYLATSNTRLDGYSYSEMGSWGSSAAGEWGYIAFGDATPAGGVPIAGAATFTGIAIGSADIMSHDYLYGGYVTEFLTGTVTLNFNFGQGTLDGAMDLQQLGKFDFTQTVFSVGGTTYSGKFDTSAAGDNYFVGSFTGPKAEETIGAWALPFVYTSGSGADNQTHQAFGAWVAKQ